MARASSNCRASVHEALGELTGAATKGLLGLNVSAGRGALQAQVDEVVGSRGKHDPTHAAVIRARFAATLLPR